MGRTAKEGGEAEAGQVGVNGFLFVAAFLFLLQLGAALFAMGMGFLPIFIWWLFVPMVLCLIAWRLTRHGPQGYIRKED